MANFACSSWQKVMDATWANILVVFVTRDWSADMIIPGACLSPRPKVPANQLENKVISLKQKKVLKHLFFHALKRTPPPPSPLLQFCSLEPS